MKTLVRRTAEFLLIVIAVLAVQYLVARYAKYSMGLAPDKIAESFLSTFSSALTLLLSTWVAYRIAHSKQQQDNTARRKENVMAFYNSMSSPEFVITRRHAKTVIKSFPQHPNQSFEEFHRALSQPERASVSSLLLLFRKLQLGLDNCYFDLRAITACFGDEIVIWHDGCLNEALENITWPSAIALRDLYKSVKATATSEQLVLWISEADQLKSELKGVQ